MTKHTSLSLRATVLVNALQDANFRKELIADPTSAYERKFGSAPELDIRVHDESAREFVLLIPQKSSDVEEQIDKTIAEFDQSDAPPTRGQLEGLIVRKAWDDASYRAKLEKDPRAALDAELSSYDTKMPADVDIKVLVEGKGESLIVLPANIGGRNSGELTDAELEAVAGGATDAVAAIPVAWIVAAVATEVGKTTVGSTVGATTGSVVAVKVSTGVDSDVASPDEFK